MWLTNTNTYRDLYIASVQCNGWHWPRNGDFAPENPAKLLHSPILVAVGLSVRYKYKSKVSVLSPHPGSELSCADFHKYLPWSLGLYSPYIHLDIHLNSLGVYSRSHASWRHGLQTRPHRYPFAPGSREAMQRELPCSGAQRADTPTGYTHLLNSELDLDSESCALPLDQLAATRYEAWPPIDWHPFVNGSYKYVFGLPQLRWFMGSHEWEFPLVFRAHWQSPALTTGT